MPVSGAILVESSQAHAHGSALSNQDAAALQTFDVTGATVRQLIRPTTAGKSDTSRRTDFSVSCDPQDQSLLIQVPSTAAPWHKTQA